MVLLSGSVFGNQREVQCYPAELFYDDDDDDEIIKKQKDIVDYSAFEGLGLCFPLPPLVC
jgi:hypothetical protein